MSRLTKIVATIGPATESEVVIEQLMKAGMNVARFNTKHGTPEWHAERMRRVRKVAQKLNLPIAILLDLQGPEIRVELPEEKEFSLASGEQTTLTDDRNHSGKIMYVPAKVIDTLNVGQTVLLDDGACEFTVTDKGNRELKLSAVGECIVKHRKSLGTPGVTIDMPSLIEADLRQLDVGKDLNVDYVGLSYVRGKADIEILRQELLKRQLKAKIIAKIENQAALDNLDQIIKVSDAVMVARGDLAVEVPFEQLTFWQKLIISKCRQAAKPVITATQMLKSMVDNPRPTRAEVSDVANAVYDSTSAVMLSEETTIGKYPVRAVETQAKIALFNEPYVEPHLTEAQDADDSSGITHAAMHLIQHRTKQIDGIVCLTETGRTAGLLAKFRPKQPVHALTSNEQTYRQLSLQFGVMPHIMEFPDKQIQEPHAIAREVANLGIMSPGQTALVIYGSIWKTPGLTNSLSLVVIPGRNE